jgi:hypothetical protein
VTQETAPERRQARAGDDEVVRVLDLGRAGGALTCPCRRSLGRGGPRGCACAHVAGSRFQKKILTLTGAKLSCHNETVAPPRAFVNVSPRYTGTSDSNERHAGVAEVPPPDPVRSRVVMVGEELVDVLEEQSRVLCGKVNDASTPPGSPLRCISTNDPNIEEGSRIAGDLAFPEHRASGSIILVTGAFGKGEDGHGVGRDGTEDRTKLVRAKRAPASAPPLGSGVPP